mmetsp:Transcript_73507/g.117154  ORF Transcript_73507/g.117154 Transcript_73507/m.117154 type:complete len:268 (-) Transcript_73507:55-858(-)
MCFHLIVHHAVIRQTRPASKRFRTLVALKHLLLFLRHLLVIIVVALTLFFLFTLTICLFFFFFFLFLFFFFFATNYMYGSLNVSRYAHAQHLVGMNSKMVVVISQSLKRFATHFTFELVLQRVQFDMLLQRCSMHEFLVAAGATQRFVSAPRSAFLLIAGHGGAVAAFQIDSIVVLLAMVPPYICRVHCLFVGFQSACIVVLLLLLIVVIGVAQQRRQITQFHQVVVVARGADVDHVAYTDHWFAFARHACGRYRESRERMCGRVRS